MRLTDCGMYARAALLGTPGAVAAHLPDRGKTVADFVVACQELRGVKEYAAGLMKGINDWTDEEVVSADFVSCKFFFVFDVKAGFASGRRRKFFS